MHVNVKIYIRFQILLVWTFTEYYINIFGGAERYSGPPRNNFGGAAALPLPTPLLSLHSGKFGTLAEDPLRLQHADDNNISASQIQKERMDI